MAGKFEVYKDTAGKYRFRLKATNGQTILSSEAYSSKEACRNGIASVQRNGPDPARYERKTAKNGKFHFVLKAANHQVIGSSQTYDSERTMETGVASVQKNSTTITIDDTTA